MRFGVQFTAAMILAAPAVIISVSAAALTPSEVGDIAKLMTVRIQGLAETTGSGFIIEKRGDRYKVLTCRHVVENHLAFTITTSDQKRHETRSIAIEPFGQELDLAIVEFESQDQYPVATIGDSSQVQSGQTAFVAGFPARNTGDTSSFFLFNEGKINGRADDSLRNGYGLIYNINTLPGMSGGPVLNDQGQVIGVHGQGDQAEDVTVLLEASEVNPGVVVKSGFNYAIPINTFKQFATAAKVNFTPVSAVPSSQPRGVSSPTPVIRSTPRSLRVQPPEAIALEGTYDPLALWRESVENRVRFEQKYTNKILTIRGKVSSIIPPQIGPDRGVTVSVKSATGETLFGLPKVIYCNGVSPETAARLNRDDILTVQGIYRGKSAINTVHLKACTVVAR